MKILYLSSSTVPSRAANSVQVVKMCDAMVRAGHTVRLFCRPPEGGEAQLDAVRALYGIGRELQLEAVRQPKGRLFGRALYARRVAKRAAPYLADTDLLYARDMYSLAALRNCGRPLIYEAHMPPANAFKRALQRRLFRSPDFLRLVTVSERLADYYRAMFPELHGKSVVVAPNGADTPASAAANEEPRRSVGYVGQLHAHKGPALLLQLARALPEVDFHVVGGSEADIRRLRTHAPANLTFHGHVPQGELSAWYRSFKLVLAPYRRAAGSARLHDDTEWGSPLKIFEYMAHGCCIVASDLPVIRELVGDNEAAALCGEDAAGEWAAKVTELLQEPQRRAQLSAAAQRRFLAHYTREARVKRVLALSGHTR
ncbi:MAG: glycosyltransferase [Spirochaetaceae bacterium]|nr:MAG: glycosyltransferase [Spirochaetaceae bacterium]